MIDAERQSVLDAIATEVAVCKRCRLHQTRTRAVPGEGTAATEVMFVGEGPGFNEDRQGRPFVGQAGALLTELLGSVGWSRDEVFITNIVKCRPPENRDPEPDEIAACAPYLARQLKALDPALVVTLGRYSMAHFNPGARIGQVHGTFRAADAAARAPGVLTFAMYHPAAALHQGSLKETLFRDMEGVPAALLEARAKRGSMPASVSVVEPRSSDAGAPATDPEPRMNETATIQAASAAGGPGGALGEGSDETINPFESDPTPQLPLF